ncbi:hypothetical protein [Paenibacillus contaminans]|uniref:Uncharacterized protein n=1 Tax=Paenibacillus contaminans TaxID=450362 RepID=A0A329MHG9_9BACL|nr:hypothetical protein [Paenibacillus contaminans]RAV18806.1 hypothetical protein DQG23_24050 [Paenibacillus contaminans]
MEVKAGMHVWSTVFECNVDVVRVFKNTATIRTWGGWLMAGKTMTFRGQAIDTLQPRRQRAA